MRQIILKQPGVFVERDVPPPEREPGMALVRIHGVGICGSDFQAFAGRQPAYTFPRVIGHELSCQVLEAPDDATEIVPGDMCAIEPYVNCGHCTPCRLNRPNCCENLRLYGLHIDGGMQPLLNVPVRLLHKSAKLSADQLALIETLGIGAHAVARSGLTKGEAALVVGAGPIGLAVTQFAVAAGADVRVVEKNEARRNFIAALGVETLAQPDERLANVVFDATGVAQVMAESLELVAPAGRLVLVGVCPESVEIRDPLFHKREITIYASRNSCHQFPRIIRMIEDGLIDTSPWITHRLTLAEVPREFAGLLKRPGLVKAMVEVRDSDL